ncbi:MAG: hypothetical protein IIV40_02145, partial [Oscillospiraceae bacterium]|nr:hypothetical protein [Oscillospiraceae bacterium]
VGFLVVQDGSVRMLPATCATVADRVVELIPTVMEDVKNLISKSGSAGMMCPGHFVSPFTQGG